MPFHSCGRFKSPVSTSLHTAPQILPLPQGDPHTSVLRVDTKENEISCILKQCSFPVICLWQEIINDDNSNDNDYVDDNDDDDILLIEWCTQRKAKKRKKYIMPIVLSRSRILPPRLASIGHCVIGLHVKQPQLCTLPPSPSWLIAALHVRQTKATPLLYAKCDGFRKYSTLSQSLRLQGRRAQLKSVHDIHFQ